IYIAEKQSQDDSPAVELKAVHAVHQHRPQGTQFARQRAEFRIARMQLHEVPGSKWMFLDGNVVKLRRPLRVFPPRVPRCKEIQAQPETRLEEREALACAPAFREGVAAQEHMPRLRRATIA